MASPTQENNSISTKTVKKQKTTSGSKQKQVSSGKQKQVSSGKQALANKGPITNWTESEVICESLDLLDYVVKNVIRLLDEGCTIPFIARYRKEMTGEMEVQKLRDFCSMLEDLRAVISKIESVRGVIESAGKLTKELDRALMSAKTMTEVEDLYAPYKPGVKTSLAERARALGLEPAALHCLNGATPFSVADYASLIPADKGVTPIVKAKEGILHIIADIIHKDTETMETMRKLCTDRRIKLETKKSTSKVKQDPKPGVKPEPAHKYENYFDRQFPIYSIQSHQVLAINRGEDHKILTVKVIIPPGIENDFKNYCWYKFTRKKDPTRTEYIQESIALCFDRFVRPQMCRLIRSQLTKKAVSSSIEVFGNNLKKLLLSPPLRGSTILAVDPGFSNGCKCSVISQTGQILATEVVYIHKATAKIQPFQEKCKLLGLVNNHRCDVFAIGNGCGCRETEAYVSNLIKLNCPSMKYCVVDESGASIYSVSDAAQKEMPHLDVSLRGAVSIGRRLLDPLAEFIKVDPKHIGVGQYQHDMPQAQLKSSLDCTIQECVSFVGVDINTCSECLLSRVAGLTATRAKNIIDYRGENGSFVCRQQILKVKGVGPKSYEQAAGFIRVHISNRGAASQVESVGTPEPEANNNPTTSKAGSKRKQPAAGRKAKKQKLEDFKPNPLDMTEIHPESYDTTHRLLDAISADVSQLGQPVFMNAVKQYVAKHSLSKIAEDLSCGEPTVKLITDTLAKPMSYDFRDGFQKPLFRSSASSLSNLTPGNILTGVVRNVTHFGAFVDVGVGNDGLIHISRMNARCLNGKSCVDLGDKVEVRVLDVDVKRSRLGLEVVRLL